MELLTDKANIVYLEGAVDWSVTAEWRLDGVDQGALETPTFADGVWSTTLPYTTTEGHAEVLWSVTIPGSDPFVKTSHHEVTTPYLTVREIKEFWEDATDTEAKEVERAARHIINAHTGQKFGKTIGIKIVRGDGNVNLRLPERLLSIVDINGYVPGEEHLDIIGDGWYLKIPDRGVPPVKADYYGLHQHVGGVIHNPNSVRYDTWRKSWKYRINGTWGWEYVPEAIKEAARLLVNDYACADSQYRDRYLTSIRSADWRIEFNSGAFARTGNVRADQLLSAYVTNRGWAVI